VQRIKDLGFPFEAQTNKNERGLSNFSAANCDNLVLACKLMIISFVHH